MYGNWYFRGSMKKIQNFIVLRKNPEYTKNDLCIDCVDGINNDRSLMLSHTSQMLCSYRMLYKRQAVN